MLSRLQQISVLVRLIVASGARSRPEAWIFAGSLFAHLVLLSLLFLFFEVRWGTYEYREIALNVAQGHGFVLRPGDLPILYRPPLYIYFLAGIYAIFGDHHLPVVIVQALLGAATAVVAYRIGNRLFGEPIGVGTAVLVTVHPLMWYNAGRVMTETLFTFLLSLVVLLLVEVVQGGGRRVPPALGVAVGLASLCRATFQFFPLALLSVACWPAALGPSMGERFRRAGVAAACAIVVIFPWSVRNAVVSGGYLIPIDTSGGYTLWVGNARLTDGLDDDGLTPEGLGAMKVALASLLGVDPASPKVRDGRILRQAWSPEGNVLLFREALSEVAAHPLTSAWLALKKLGRFWFHLMRQENRRLQPVVVALQLVVLVPAVLGAVLAVRRRLPVLPLFLVMGYLIVLHMAATANARYSVPILPYLIMLGVYGVWRLTGQQLR